ncbi:MAG: DNA primase [Endomicrobium sp.]|jgi:DNA primase|nr:DNA primase [Endomicrobium sp.]
MAIPDDIIENVRLSNNIESVIREYIPDLKRVGRNWKACCLFHNEKTPSFIVSPEKGIFRCFGCNVSGDVFKFVMLADNISWIEAIKKLAKRANITIQETKQSSVKPSQKLLLLDILENSAIFYHRCLMENASSKKAMDYLIKRGITRDTIVKSKIGFCPKGQLIQAAVKKGIAIDDLIKAGLVTKTDKGTFFEYMSERIVFPIFDVQGRIVAFGGRTLTDQQPKYINTPETIVYSKSSNLYGLFQTLPLLRRERKVIVLEGYMDVVIPQQFGVVGAVASLGTAFTQKHAKLISRYADSVTLLFDSDDAGRTAACRALEVLVEEGIETKVSSLPENVDADEYLNQYGKEAFLRLIETTSKSAIDFMITRIYGNKQEKSPEIKAKAVSQLLDFVAKSSNAIVQSEWIKNISQYLNIEETIVYKEFKKKKALKLSGYTKEDGINLSKRTSKNKKVTMSLEENLLNIILNNREFAQKVNLDCFFDARCKKIFELATSGLSDTEILNSLSQEDAIWFSELTLNSIEYNNINEAFNTILKDIELTLFKKRRALLEKEILLMTEGKKKRDDGLFDEYKKLTILLKGSGK